MSDYRSNYTYYHDKQRLDGYVAYDERNATPKPAVLVIPDWSGRNAFACQKAEELAAMGYVGFAVDMYGDGRTGETVEEKTALMQTVVNDRLFLRARIRAALDAVAALEQVDAERIAVIGFCFGGLCALDLARSGVKIRGVVSFHGLLDKPKHLENQVILAKILALHGYDDPMVTPAVVNEFCQEMTQAGVDWQVHMYGQTKHAFTNPLANDSALGLKYNACVSERAFQLMHDFLQEIF
jgi:dienelactone hydrolase